MIIRISLSVIFILFSVQSYCQETKVFVLDMASPKVNSFASICIENDSADCLKEKLSVKTNQLLAFKLKNANPFKYTYELNKKTLDLFSDSKARFEKKQEGVIDLIKKTSPTDQESEAGKAINGVTTIEAFTSKIDTLKTTVSNLSDEISEIKVRNQELSSETKLIEYTSFDFEIQSLIGTNKKLIKDKENLISELNQKIQKGQIALEQNRRKKEDLNKKYETLQNDLKPINDKAKKQEKIDNKAKFRGFRLQIEANSIRMRKVNKEAELYLSELEAKDYLIIEKHKDKRTSLEKRYDAIIDATNKVTHKAENTLNIEYSGLFNETLKNKFIPLVELASKSIDKLYSFKTEHYTLPYEFDGKNIDALEFTLKRRAKKESSSFLDEKKYNIWIKGGFKIDISAGVFLSTLTNKEYSIQTMSEEFNGVNEEYQIINEKNLGSLNYGFGSVANLSYRTGTWIKPTFSFGAMFTDEQKFQFLLGGGFIVGKMSRFVFHYGISVGRTTTIQDSFVADGNTRYQFSSNETIPTVEKLGIGQFFGLTYNLGKAKSLKNKN
ncbi:hypothetical protein ABN763_04615 [Spongiivirga sp. MCCC 1A20706]|uniref:hypothetical protein n=1 Tax=Spongiivirga sp. MCCC 1A20706 TaxID=3160963 RepID=UPI003977718B